MMIIIIDHFQYRKMVAENLIYFIRMKGYTKSMFSEKIGISRPTLDKILHAESPNRLAFNKQIRRITNTLGLPDNYFLSK
jgi:hypothetical protein